MPAPVARPLSPPSCSSAPAPPPLPLSFLSSLSPPPPICSPTQVSPNRAKASSSRVEVFSGCSMAEPGAPGSPESGQSGGGDQGGAGHAGGGPREQDRFLPIANIGRIMRKAIPENGKIAKDAKESVQECVSEFISFITSEASDKCQKEKRKTINGDDLLWAMGTLGFEEYVEPLRAYLNLYREGDVKGSRSGDLSGRKDNVANGDASFVSGQQGSFDPGSSYFVYILSV
ncbi:hypothetical protein Taro_007246 [Colocasia esculenta]|uniref:Transcription factor CBF/NF-Y/archaeal histone domain-containing protein n=1 Tax=Colocasia esculenta TaxID=4460 RepID=A0A843U3B6_COLES|nr:hypothetical protein [Colocasia esculenta]